MDTIQQTSSDSVPQAPNSAPETVSGRPTDAQRARRRSTGIGKSLALSLPPRISLASGLPRVLSQLDEHRAAGLFIFVFLVNTWLLNIIAHADWVPVLGQELDWLLNPTLGKPDLALSLWGILGAAQVWFVGTLAVALVLQGEQDKGLLRIAAIAFGLGLIGWVSMIAAIAGRLDRLGTNVAVLCLAAVLVLLGLVRRKFSPSQFANDLRASIQSWSIGKPQLNASDVAFFGGLFAIAIVEYYHATTVPILHWDALVYHATMAKMMFEYSGIPTIAGPSVGIQMSANYPALFPALGTFFYVQVGAAQDVYLRLISPTAGILAALFVYKTAVRLGGKTFGRAAALFLALSPLYIAISIYALNYMLAVLFVSAVMFFLVRAATDGAERYWVAAGLSTGLIFSTTYQAFFFLPAVAIALLVAIKTMTPSRRVVLIRNLSLMGISALVIGSAWYIRNLAIVGNPIFPFGAALFGGTNIDAEMLARSIAGIRADSVYNAFGEFEFGPLELPRLLFLNKSHFPVLSAITIFGLVLALRQKNRAAWIITLAFGLVPLVIVSSAVANIFPRYFIFAFPGMALVSALPLAQAAQILARPRSVGESRQNFRVRLLASSTWQPPSRASRTAVLAFVGFMFATAVFPSSFALFSGQVYQESDWQPPYSPLLLLQHPNQEASQVLASFFGPDPGMWQWLDQHAESGRVATFENKIYYFNSNTRDSILYLDGWEARDLYGMADPADAVRYLAQHGVRFILDPSWIHHWLIYGVLPLDRYLGMPQYFPMVQGTSGDTAIYRVGRIDDAVTAQSPLALSHQPFELSSSADGTYWQLLSESVTPRLFVETPKDSATVSIEIDYVDRGRGSLTVNRRTAIGWAYGEGVAQLDNSGRVQTLRFTIPADHERGYAELGLFASPVNVLVTGIRARVVK